jgi:hypothetical protein
MKLFFLWFDLSWLLIFSRSFSMQLSLDFTCSHIIYLFNIGALISLILLRVETC